MRIERINNLRPKTDLFRLINKNNKISENCLILTQNKVTRNKKTYALTLWRRCFTRKNKSLKSSNKTKMLNHKAKWSYQSKFRQS